MVFPRRLVVLLAALLFGAAPASALAQGAGDDQYQDPFGDTVPQTASPTATPAPSGSGSQATTPPTVTAQAPGLQDNSTSGQTPAAAPSATTVQRSQLPATGSDALMVGMLGVAFVMGGAGLRLRLRDGAFAG